MTVTTVTARGALYREELLDRVLPWWEANAVDPSGGVFTCFSNDGRLVSRDKYTWSQGRWAWLCAQLGEGADAGVLALDAPLWRARARATARHLGLSLTTDGTEVAFLTDQSGGHLAANEEGEVAVSVYADLFAALGFVAAAETADDEDRAAWRAAAHRLLDSAAVRVRDGSARSEPYPVPTGFTDLGRTMLLMSVATEVHRYTGSAESLAVVEETMTRIVAPGGQWSAERRWEFKPDDPAGATADSMLANHINPGHILELAWMLLDAADVSATTANLLPDWLPAVVLETLDRGWDHERGGLFRFVDHRGGAPSGRRLGGSAYELLVDETWDTKLWWVHIEALLACEIFAARSDDPAFAVWADRLATYTFSTFPDPAGTEWIQIRDRAGAPLDRVVALPVKDPFHIPRALIRMIGLLERTPAL
ncbi:AGE family epimerase/isomerase [Glaciihabitans sp. dw_435]|uniref:AGE family epimerase/isomerase n=1 Tax=Glaciihabitans sp. dw_435 TaxID=2720081 RepID=UPI001BD6B89A|nr:AGE family epimerase/isomerase [Glaciihabitans sp. dw_435]